MTAFIVDNMAPIMFAALVIFLLLGYPVAFSLGALGLAFGFLGVDLGLLHPALFQALPELFGEEGHGGVEQAEGGFESGQHVAPAGVQAGVSLEAELLQLHVPIAELMPEEGVKRIGCFVELIILKILFNPD